MNEPTARHRNALAAAMILGFVPNDYKGKKSKTKCQQKKPVRMRSLLRQPNPGYTLRQCSKHLFIDTERGKFLTVNNGKLTERPIERNSKIGRKYAK